MLYNKVIIRAREVLENTEALINSEKNTMDSKRHFLLSAYHQLDGMAECYYALFGCNHIWHLLIAYKRMVHRRWLETF